MLDVGMLNYEGGTFALYSLICRHAKVSLIPSQLPSDTRISSFRLKVPSPELERSLIIKDHLENSLGLKKFHLMLVLAATSMVIADGVVTPAMSAVDGLWVSISGIKHVSEVHIWSSISLVVCVTLCLLFSHLVKLESGSLVGMEKVKWGLFIWFCCMAGIGILNVLRYDRDAGRPLTLFTSTRLLLLLLQKEQT